MWLWRYMYAERTSHVNDFVRPMYNYFGAANRYKEKARAMAGLNVCLVFGIGALSRLGRDLHFDDLRREVVCHRHTIERPIGIAVIDRAAVAGRGAGWFTRVAPEGHL